MAAAKQADICLGCNKKFKKNETSVQCTVCGLWCHKDCAAISNEFLKFLEEQKKNTGLAYWACRPCIVYSQGITHRMKEMEKRLTTVEEGTKKATENVEKLEKKVEKVSDQQGRMGDKIDKKISQSETRIFEELRERESKRLNVVLHGVEEAAGKETSGERRAAWDTKR
jgi:TolA-binding protein